MFCLVRRRLDVTKNCRRTREEKQIMEATFGRNFSFFLLPVRASSPEFPHAHSTSCIAPDDLRVQTTQEFQRRENVCVWCTWTLFGMEVEIKIAGDCGRNGVRKKRTLCFLIMTGGEMSGCGNKFTHVWRFGMGRLKKRCSLCAAFNISKKIRLSLHQKSCREIYGFRRCER